MKSTMLILIACLFSLSSCSSEDPVPDPIPEGETVITVSQLPDSVRVETSSEIKFTVSQKNHPEEFQISVDTVMPYYYLTMGYNSDGDKIFDYKRTGKADITINGKAFSNIKTVTPGKEYTISFSNQTAVGEYKIILNVTDKYKRTTKQEVKIKVFSPEVIIKFYDYFPGFDEDKYFEMLNSKFTYNPLSEELKGIRVDTIYTREKWKSVILPDGTIGYDSVTTTIPGQGIVCYIEQEGGENMQDFYANQGLVRGADKKQLTNTDFATRVDGIAYWQFDDVFKQGFHGIMFETSTKTKVGSFFYTLRVVDKWGKEKMETIVYKAFARTEKIPAHATPSDEQRFWWGHRISD